MKKKVQGSSQVKEVEIEGLREHRAGSEKGVNKPNPKAVGQPNIVSKDLKPYPNRKKIVKDEFHGISVTIENDEKAMRKFIDENS